MADLPVIWKDIVGTTQSWIPGSRYPAWSSKKIVYFRCQPVQEGQCRGPILDVQLPSLEQSAKSRNVISTMEGIFLHYNGTMNFQPGFTYVPWGTLCPIWHSNEAMWHIQMPAQTAKSGVARMLGARQLPMGIRALALLLEDWVVGATP